MTKETTDRLNRAIGRLEEKRSRSVLFERERLSGKIEGVKLALSYLDEAAEFEYAIAVKGAPQPHSSNEQRYESAKDARRVIDAARTRSHWKIMRRPKPQPWQDVEEHNG